MGQRKNRGTRKQIQVAVLKKNDKRNGSCYPIETKHPTITSKAETNTQ